MSRSPIIQQQIDARRKAERQTTGAIVGVLFNLARLACLATVAYLGGWLAFFAGCLLFVVKEALFRGTGGAQPGDSPEVILGTLLWAVLILAFEAVIWVGWIGYLWTTP